MHNFTFIKQGKELSQQNIHSFELRHKVVLPNDYRNFLLTCNGGMIIPEVYETLSGSGISISKFYSLDDNHPYDLDHSCISTDWKDAYRNGYLEIARDAGGSGILISTKGDSLGGIFYFDREASIRSPSGALLIADCLTQLLESLVPYEEA